MKQKILQAAVKVAEAMPLNSVTRADIARRAKCAPSLVTWYLGNAYAIRAEIVAEAVATNNVKVVAGALSVLPLFPGMVPETLQRKALKSLAA